MTPSVEQGQEFARDHFEAAGDEIGCLALMLWTYLPDCISIDPRDDNYVDTRGLAEQLIAGLDTFRAAALASTDLATPESKASLQKPTDGDGGRVMDARERKIVLTKVGNNVICDVCRAGLATFDEACVAPLGAWCPGFDAIEAALGYPGGRQEVWRPVPTPNSDVGSDSE